MFTNSTAVHNDIIISLCPSVNIQPPAVAVLFSVYNLF